MTWNCFKTTKRVIQRFHNSLLVKIDFNNNDIVLLFIHELLIFQNSFIYHLNEMKLNADICRVESQNVYTSMHRKWISGKVLPYTWDASAQTTPDPFFSINVNHDNRLSTNAHYMCVVYVVTIANLFVPFKRIIIRSLERERETLRLIAGDRIFDKKGTKKNGVDAWRIFLCLSQFIGNYCVKYSQAGMLN